MEYKGTYKGIGDYKENYIKGSIKKTLLTIIFIITFISTLVFITSKFINNDSEEMLLSNENITKYIDICDEASVGGFQLNWQEVAAINGSINNGSFDIDNDVISKIINSFYKKDDNGNVIGLSSFKVVAKSLKLNSEEEETANKYLEGLKNNYIHRELAKDNSKLEFINEISEIAFDNYKSYGILPSITIAQAILESGWGESTLSSEYNNLFGIKADERWSGDSIDLQTKENYDDVIVGAFRSYKDIKSSIRDHGKFLWENKRYSANGLFEAKSYKDQAQALENAGYSTAKDEEGNLIYGDKLIRVIQENNLMLYDTKVQRK
ncbi:glucosaminidase domain-containing protein [Clostridium sp.]|uniref:glycoside hydrolase family 73 protein n=1 Tax=Clostridium sp. TaxID=1506 RepID=UPI0025B9F952|nr:glucosaminidase domain-containing protein [Clostridium sp.]